MRKARRKLLILNVQSMAQLDFQNFDLADYATRVIITMGFSNFKFLMKIAA
jgi:hypothetical protein